MGLFTKKRRDADYIKPNDAIGAIMPFIMPKRCDAEVSSTVEMDITKLVEYVDKQNEKDLGYKMTYFHALTSCMAKVFYNREALNYFVKNKRLYKRKKMIFGFIAKNKLSDKGEERIICLEIEKDDNIMSLSKKMAVDVFKVREEGTNDMDGILKLFTLIFPIRFFFIK